jgi:phosphoglycerol transferase MdoB-like AlkP superfamily enzyme
MHTKYRNIVWYIGIVTFVITYVLCLYFTNFSPRKNMPLFGLLPWITSMIPLLWSLAIGSIFLPRLIPLLLLSASLIVLSIGNQEKLYTTQEPLLWTDLLQTAHLPIIWAYMQWWHPILIIVLSIGCIFGFYYSWRLDPPSWRQSLISMFLAALLTPLALYPFFSGQTQYDLRYGGLSLAMEHIGIRYVPWDKTRNIQRNGLPFHLVQTSYRTLPKKATKEQIQEFNTLNNAPNLSSYPRPKHIIFILCESCWHNEQFFNDDFLSLRQQGFVHFRGVSPVFGGGTVNASFEMLSGLPSTHPSLSGIIYQEYAKQLSPKMTTLPWKLHDLGYHTIAMHAYHRNFWQRNIVKPKIGFDHFLSGEGMNIKLPADKWETDQILYTKAKDVLLKHKNQPLFLYLITISTHGPYGEGSNENKISTFKQRLNQAISDIADFANYVRIHHPDSLLLVYGDHKPELGNFYYKNGIFPRSSNDELLQDEMAISRSPVPIHIRGDVPIYMYHRDRNRLQQFAEEAEGLPFFCIIKRLNDHFLFTNLPVFGIKPSPCDHYKSINYNEIVKKFPDWLYDISLFHNQSLEQPIN